jgi:hypothetical protein
VGNSDSRGGCVCLTCFVSLCVGHCPLPNPLPSALPVHCWMCRDEWHLFPLRDKVYVCVARWCGWGLLVAVGAAARAHPPLSLLLPAQVGRVFDSDAYGPMRDSLVYGEVGPAELLPLLTRLAASARRRKARVGLLSCAVSVTVATAAITPLPAATDSPAEATAGTPPGDSARNLCAHGMPWDATLKLWGGIGSGEGWGCVCNILPALCPLVEASCSPMAAEHRHIEALSVSADSPPPSTPNHCFN